MTYTSTASDFGDTKPEHCSLVVFLCTTEAFGGLLYAGMFAAILFGKVRDDGHAHMTELDATHNNMARFVDSSFSSRSIECNPTPTSYFPMPYASNTRRWTTMCRRTTWTAREAADPPLLFPFLRWRTKRTSFR